MMRRCRIEEDARPARNAAGVHPGRSPSRNAIVTAARRWREAENPDKAAGAGRNFPRKSDRREVARKV